MYSEDSHVIIVTPYPIHPLPRVMNMGHLAYIYIYIYIYISDAKF